MFPIHINIIHHSTIYAFTIIIRNGSSIKSSSSSDRSYDAWNDDNYIQNVADKGRKRHEELTNRLRENEIRTISRENDIYEAQELISENNDLIYSSYDELSAEIDERIELFRKKLEKREEKKNKAT